MTDSFWPHDVKKDSVTDSVDDGAGETLKNTGYEEDGDGVRKRDGKGGEAKGDEAEEKGGLTGWDSVTYPSDDH